MLKLNFDESVKQIQQGRILIVGANFIDSGSMLQPEAMSMCLEKWLRASVQAGYKHIDIAFILDFCAT